MLLGCIADDFTGATDLAGMLVRGGMRTLLVIGVPTPDTLAGMQADAVVVALKSRTIAAADAVAQSLAAWQALRAAGARQCFFKYCSTFDSTDAGNIGPVTDALMQATGAALTIACPAFPENGRTVFRGHLFVGDLLLSDSGMREHPLTPMTDSNLVRVLQRQTGQRVGLARFDAVAAGATALAARLQALQAEGVAIAIVDALGNDDLLTIGRACAELPLITGGSGVALGLPANFARAGLLPADPALAAAMPALHGHAAVLSGSCSSATNAQVAAWCAHRPALRIDPLRIAAGDPVLETSLHWALARLPQEPVLLYATAEPAQVREVQQALGVEAAGRLIETLMAGLARGLVAAGVDRLVVAGGETSGAVVEALGLSCLRVGPQIDPGVPWMLAQAQPGQAPLALALKSGNFGSTNFFAKALAQLETGA
jgi:uncharacterized protein YgbK (DUF1537 family)